MLLGSLRQKLNEERLLLSWYVIWCHYVLDRVKLKSLFSPCSLWAILAHEDVDFVPSRQTENPNH